MEIIEESIDHGEGFDSFEAWLASRPACVQALGKEFPIGTQYVASDGPAWLIGYTESDELIFSRVNPYLHWSRAVAERFYCDAIVLREALLEGSHERTH